MLASRLELEAPTILEGIQDEARRAHAESVLRDTATALRDHESRRPVADALDEVVRTMERVRAHLDQAEEPGGLASVVGSIDARTWVGIIMAIAAALGAATGLDVADILGDP
tara:strand:- start:299 stop:634 length:336 start_codon:yes stop_codon:yes gene_type:complete